MVCVTDMYQLKRQCIEDIWFYAQLALQVGYQIHGPWFTLAPCVGSYCKAKPQTYYQPKMTETQKNSQFLLQLNIGRVVSDESVDLPFYLHHSQLTTRQIVAKIVNCFVSLNTDEGMHYPTLSICFVKGFPWTQKIFFFFFFWNKWIIVLDTMF